MNSPGIYQISNLANGKFYIGSAVNLTKRWYMHLNQLRLGKHRNAHLQRAWSKYGADAFQFSVVEHVSDKTVLIEREQAWLDAFFDPERIYNICMTASSRLGVKTRPETKAKMSAARMGHKCSEETKVRMSASKTGKKMPEFTEQHRQNMKAARALRGPVSEETRKKLRKPRKKPNGPPSEETRRKISEGIKRALAAKKIEVKIDKDAK